LGFLSSTVAFSKSGVLTIFNDPLLGLRTIRPDWIQSGKAMRFSTLSHCITGSKTSDDDTDGDENMMMMMMMMMMMTTTGQRRQMTMTLS